MGILRRYDTLEYAEALVRGGETEYRRLSNLEGLHARGFKEMRGSGDFYHRDLRIRVTRDTLTYLHMLPALDRMMARKRRELGKDA